MKDKKLQKGIDEIKSIKMTDTEKDLIFSNILKSEDEIVKPTKSTWVNFSFMAILERNRLVYYIIIPLIFILSGSGVVFASIDSLPDSILYPIKVKVLEPVKGAFLLSQTSKAKHEINLAQKRLIEAETLARENKLDARAEDRINTLLEDHTKALNNNLEKVRKVKQDGEDEADEISLDFDREMNQHAKILDGDNKKISNKARENAEKIKEKFKKVEKKDKEDNDD